MAGIRLCLKWLSQVARYYVVWSQSSHQEVSGTGFENLGLFQRPCGVLLPGAFSFWADYLLKGLSL